MIERNPQLIKVNQYTTKCVLNLYLCEEEEEEGEEEEEEAAEEEEEEEDPVPLMYPSCTLSYPACTLSFPFLYPRSVLHRFKFSNFLFSFVYILIKICFRRVTF